MEKALVKIHGQKIVTDSLTIADKFRKRHKNVIQKIENLIEDDEKGRLIFQPRDYVDKRGKTQKVYKMDRKSFSVLAMSFSGKKALQWKMDFYDAFERMEKYCLQDQANKQNSAWGIQRKAGKLIRKEETDTIQEFIEYAFAQGSTNAKRYYSNISTMENKALFILEQKFKNLRNILNLNQLALITSADGIVKKAIKDGMTEKLHYKDIYKLAKNRVSIFADIHGQTFIPVNQTPLLS